MLNKFDVTQGKNNKALSTETLSINFTLKEI